MQIPTIQSSIDLSRLGALLLLLTLAPTSFSAVYKCPAKGGGTTYSDMPCDQNSQVIELTPDRLHSTQALSAPSPPEQAGMNQMREQIASTCTASEYSAWWRAQDPKPSPPGESREDERARAEMSRPADRSTPIDDFACPAGTCHRTNAHPSNVARTVQGPATRTRSDSPRTIRCPNRVPRP